MCGGAILAGFIPRNRGLRVTASDIWPNSPFAKLDPDNFFDSNPSPLTRTDSSPRKRAQPTSGTVFFLPLSYFSVKLNPSGFWAWHFYKQVTGKKRSPPRGRGRTSTEASGSVRGANGPRRFVIPEKGFEFGLVPSTPLKRQPELTIGRLAKSAVRKPRSISQTKTTTFPPKPIWETPILLLCFKPVARIWVIVICQKALIWDLAMI